MNSPRSQGVQSRLILSWPMSCPSVSLQMTAERKQVRQEINEDDKMVSSTSEASEDSEREDGSGGHSLTFHCSSLSG